MKKIIGLLAIMVLGGCATTKIIQIDYSAVFTPEESGYRFYKITNEKDGINSNVTREFGNSYSDISDRVFDIDNENTKIIYQSISKNGDIVEANYFVKNFENLNIRLQRTYKDFVFDGALSNDAKNIVFSDQRSNKVNLYMVDAEAGSRIQQITNSNNSSINPVFFNDDSQILYTEYEVAGQYYDNAQQKYVNNYEPFLWSYNVQNGGLIQYGKGMQADFFPDENKVICVRSGDKKYELWIIDLENGQEFTLLADDKKGFVQPSISPDGNKVAFTTISEIEGKGVNFDIYTINTDGTNLSQITFHPGHDYSPKWGKDSKTLYFVSQRGTSDGKHNI